MLRFLTVGDPNLVPVAVNDTATTDEDTAVVIDVVANDSDPEGLGLTIVSVTAPTSGTAVITTRACCVTYTPNANFNGTDQFDYTITDGNGVTSTATALVDVTVTAVNDPPTITSTPVTTATTGGPLQLSGDGHGCGPGRHPAGCADLLAEYRTGRHEHRSRDRAHQLDADRAAERGDLTT